MESEKLVLALSADDNKLFEDAAAEYELDIVRVASRSELLKSAKNDSPIIVVLNLSPDDGIGGAAVGEAIKQISPHTLVIFVIESTFKNIVEALSAGDFFLEKPLQSALVRFAIQTTVVQNRLQKTGRHKLHNRLDTKATEAQAIQNFTLKLSSAKRISHVAEISKGFLGEIIDFKVFAFIAIEKEEDFLRARIYLNAPVHDLTFDAIKDIIAQNARKLLGQEAAIEYIVYGQVKSEVSAWQIVEHHACELKASGETIGVVLLFNDSPFVISEPISMLCDAILTQAGIVIDRQLSLEAEKTALLHTIINNMIEGVIWIDDRRNKVLINRNAVKYLDIHSRRIESKGKISREEIFDVFRQLNLLDELFGLEARKQKMIVKALTLGEFILQFELLRVAQPGQLNIGTLIVIRDITEERKQAQEREDLWQTIAHEVKNPLHAIQGYNELLLTGVEGELKQNQKEIIEKIQNAALRISDLVNYFLNSNKLKTVPLKKKPINVAKLFDEVFETIRDEAKKRNLTLNSEVSPGAESILADPEQITIVLSNLVQNAVNYTPDNGSITLRSQPSEYAQVQPKPKKSSTQTFTKLPRYFVEISCTDTGIGIPAEAREKVFERLAQTDVPTVTGRKGTGLGLSIAARIIEEHKGWLYVASKEGQGATFIITLPLSALQETNY